ncbi:MAG: hypothetical protein ETSY2_00870 [Candidatus Entotheonella gemina]|uniref:Uncharacterized protein n=1 Tax=Candidatus Entotheonella gemina TaxID=1429439 RepID=W4MG89_9BACT|nr:MAG: hypothetical protein ETSY2_00870 [Candidatus Entotheonella gemina]
MSVFKVEAYTQGQPVFFMHKNATERGYDVSSLEISRYFKTPEEIEEWERLMREEVGLAISGNELIASGGSCCGTRGGMCDAD